MRYDRVVAWNSLLTRAQFLHQPFPPKPPRRTSPTITTMEWLPAGVVVEIGGGRTVEHGVTGVAVGTGPFVIPVGRIRWWTRIHLIPSRWVAWAGRRLEDAIQRAEEAEDE